MLDKEMKNADTGQEVKQTDIGKTKHAQGEVITHSADKLHICQSMGEIGHIQKPGILKMQAECIFWRNPTAFSGLA